MLNFTLAKEIYGVTPWMMDIHSVPIMSSILKNLRHGVKFEASAEKLNSLFVLIPENNAKLITRPWQLDNKDFFEGIGVIVLNGPITKNGGMSSYGMTQLSLMMYEMAEDDRIKAFAVKTDSGGGSSAAVEIMNDTIQEINKTKPVYALIEKGGMAASAAYGIISSCKKIYSESEMNMVGSVGTMVQFEGKEANSTDPDGTKNIRLYATKSVKKNEGFEEALNNNNYKIIVNDLLNPINEEFIGMIERNRPQLKNTKFDDGAIHFAKDVVGTFIDGIKSFSELVDMIESKHFVTSGNREFKTSTNQNSKEMTKEEFKANHPSVYAEIVSEGVTQERDRVGAWMAHAEADLEAVKNGVKGDKNITQTEREEFYVKQNAKQTLEGIKSEGGKPIQTPESKTDTSKEEKTEYEKEVEQAFDFELK